MLQSFLASRAYFLVGGGAGDKWQVPIGCGSGSQVQNPLEFLQMWLWIARKPPFEHQSVAHLRRDQIGQGSGA